MKRLRLLLILFTACVHQLFAGGSSGFVNASFSSSATTVNIGEMVTFTGNPNNNAFGGSCNTNGVTTYTWAFGPNASPTTFMTTTNPNHNNTSPTATVTFNNSGPQAVTLTISNNIGSFCSSSTSSVIQVLASAAAIPTMSEWALIILGLTLLMTMAIGIRWQMVQGLKMAQGSTLNRPFSFKYLPFEAKPFLKIFLAVLLGIIALFSLAVVFWQYEWTSADPLGILISAGIITYVIYLTRQSDS